MHDMLSHTTALHSKTSRRPLRKATKKSLSISATGGARSVGPSGPTIENHETQQVTSSSRIVHALQILKIPHWCCLALCPTSACTSEVFGHPNDVISMIMMRVWTGITACALKACDYTHDWSNIVGSQQSREMGVRGRRHRHYL